jgi:hypothetical protein
MQISCQQSAKKMEEKGGKNYKQKKEAMRPLLYSMSISADVRLRREHGRG